MRFENPANGYVEEVTGAPLWCLLFGCIYFAVKGVWTHAVASLFLAFATASISWFVYPFFATQIMRTNYLRRGWIEVGDNRQKLYIQGTAPVRSNAGRNFLFIFLMVFFAIVGFGVWLGTSQSNTEHATAKSNTSVPLPPSRPASIRDR